MSYRVGGIALGSRCSPASGLCPHFRRRNRESSRRSRNGSSAWSRGPRGASFQFLKSIEVKGFVDGPFNWNFNDPKNPQENRLRVFDRPANTFSINLVRLSLEKKAIELNSAGFRLDLDAGRDVKFFQARGLNTGDFDLEQAFITYKGPLGEGLTVTFRKFVTLLGPK
jgi:hypothetical protein